MNNIRKAKNEDISRMAELIVFNYRINFYPNFKNESFYFKELNVIDTASEFTPEVLNNCYVYDDGAVKGMIRINGDELVKLYVEPAFQSGGIGRKLLDYAVKELRITWLWVLEYNRRGVAFYESSGFHLTDERMLEDDWIPLLKMKNNGKTKSCADTNFSLSVSRGCL